MWRQLTHRCLPSSRLLLPPTNHISRRFLFQRNSLGLPTTISRKRIIRVLVAFSAGFSIYFFLEDPIPHVTPPLSPLKFVPSKVISIEEAGSDAKLLKVAVPLGHLLPSTSNFDPIWSVYIKDDDIQVERAYTPLDSIDINGHLSFWIKRYPNGEVGRWIHNKSPGDGIELRGPIKTWPWNEDEWDEIVMISGGTGITPFVQLFNTVISKSNSKLNTRFTLLHWSRIPEELPPRSLLEPMLSFSAENPNRFKLHVFVDQHEGSAASVHTPKINTGRITESVLKQCLDLKEKKYSWWSQLWPQEAPQCEAPRRLFLICGPEPMIRTVAGQYGRNLSQGPVGGILGKMGYGSSQVYKL